MDARSDPPQGDLREQAEGRLRERRAGDSDAGGADAKRLLHELQVHQIELEMQAEELVRSRGIAEQSLLRFTRLYEEAPIGYLTLDKDGRVVRLNKCAAEVLGADAETVIGTVFRSYATPSDRSVITGFLGRLAEDAHATSCDVELAPSDSSARYVRVEGAHSDDASQFNIALVDVTIRHAAEAALEEEHLLLSRAESLCHLGSWKLVLSTREYVFSDEMLRMLDADALPPAEPFLTKLERRIHPDDAVRLSQFMDCALGESHIPPTEFRIVQPNGDQRWMRIEGNYETDAAGRASAITGFMLDITDRVEAERARLERVRQLAAIDPLTGLVNRRGFALLSQQMLLHAERSGEGIVIVFIDVDGLKTINDRHGHPEGDRVLKDVATMLRSGLRASDIVARFGGDEFVVMAAGSGDGADIAVRAQVDAALAPLYARRGRNYGVSLSVGVASRASGAASRPTATLIAEADAAMYAEKERHRKNRTAADPDDAGAERRGRV